MHCRTVSPPLSTARTLADRRVADHDHFDGRQALSTEREKGAVDAEPFGEGDD